MAIVHEMHFEPATGRPEVGEPGRKDSKLDIAVVFVSLKSTLEALRQAGAIAHRLGGSITLLVPQIVPYPLPLTSPPVLIDWNEQRFRVIAEACPVDTKVCIFFCRDRDETLLRVLGLHSVVVLGGPRRWWRSTPEMRLARKLRRAGHTVVFIETE